MVDDHWKYVEKVLRAHDEDEAIIEKCGFHYRSAFEHGFKHGVESEEVKKLDIEKQKS